MFPHFYFRTFTLGYTTWGLIFQLLQAIENNVIGEIIASIVYVSTHFCYVFWVAYFGQDLSDHSDSLFEITWVYVS